MRIFLLFYITTSFIATFVFGQASDLFFSEYSEGSSYNKYIEIYNGTGSSIDLSNYRIWKITNGGSWPEKELLLSGTVENSDVYVISHSSAIFTITNKADVTWGSANWNGDDAVGLAKNINETWTLIDAIGSDGSDPGTGWDVAGVTNATVNHTLVRKPAVSQGNINWSLSAGTNSTDSEWIVYDQDTFDYLGSHLFSGSSTNNTTVQFSSSSDSVSEGEGAYTITVSITNEDASNATTVNVELSMSSTATNGSDISPYTTQTLTFPSGSSQSQSMTITILDDSDFEGDEIAIFTLQNASGGNSVSVGSPSQLTLTIKDNDAPNIVINEILADPPSSDNGDANRDGMRHYSQDEFIELVNNHGSGVDISGWTVSDNTNVRHTFPNNTVLSNSRAIVVFGGGNPTGNFGNSIVQSASTGGLGLSNSGDIVVLKASNGASVTSYTFGSEAGEDQSITRNPDITGSFVKHSEASGSDETLFSPGLKLTGRPFIGVTLNESSGGTAVTEGGTTDSYTLMLESQPICDVTITATPDNQITVAPVSLTFTSSNYQTEQMVTVTAVDDQDFEGNHSSTISHIVTSNDANYNGITINAVNVNIADNDVVGVTVIESDGHTEVVEGGSTDSYTVLLTSAPTADVTITISVSNGELSVDPTSVTFTSTNYATAQTVTATALDDQNYEGNHTSTISHVVTSSDANYNGFSIGDVTVSIQDNDVPNLIINEINYNPSGSDDLNEFIELFNTENYSLDIGGFLFTSGISFIFPSNTIFEAGQYIVVAKTSSTFSGGNYPVFQWDSGTLYNDGETVIFSISVNGVIIDQVTYDNSSPWPVEPDGGGSSLELINPSLDNSIPGNWQASFVDGGTPGVNNSSNSAPLAASDAYIVNEDDTLTIGAPGVLMNDSDINNHSLFAILNTDVSHGNVNLDSAGSFTYLPEADYFGDDSFSYFAYDGLDYSPPASVTIDVHSVNDAPVISPISDPDTIPEDSGEQTIELRGILSGTSNEIEELTVTALSANSDLISHPDIIYSTPDSIGTLIWSPVSNAWGTTTISVKVKDSGGRDNGGIDSTVVTFFVTVSAVNDTPDIDIGEIIFPEDNSVTFSLPRTDVDGDTLSYFDFITDTTAVSVELFRDTVGAWFVFTPQSNWNGTAQLIFQVSDGLVEVSESCVITVIPINDPPDPFNLIWPENHMVIHIVPEMMDESLIFSWQESNDVDLDTIAYSLIVSENLFFLATEGIDTNSWMLNYSDLIERMAGIDTVQGTWTVKASDGDQITEASNGPFILTLNASKVSVKKGELIPERFTLHQNYPNPFNPVTTIKYDIPEASNVRVEIYDILGQKVRLVKTGDHEPGYHHVRWNGQDDEGVPVPSGVYIYRITVRNPSTRRIDFAEVRRLILMK